MRFSLAVLGTLVAMSSHQGAVAFAPKTAAFGVVPKTTQSVQSKDYKLSSRSPLAMVAGGAERAYRDDYYDGA